MRPGPRPPGPGRPRRLRGRRRGPRRGPGRGIPAAALALALLPGGRGAARAQLTPQAARAWVEDHRLEAVRELGRLASIPSVASDPGGLARAREYLARRLRDHGFSVREVEGGGVPALVGVHAAGPEAPTLLLYFHYDGQEVDPSRWRNDPFAPTLYGPAGEPVGPVEALPPGTVLGGEERVVARAVADDKGTLAAFLVALDLLRDKGVAPTANFKVFLDGDEESGSPGLRRILEAPGARELLAADAVVILDAPLYPTDDPTLYLGTRGIVTADLTVFGARVPLHSGHYGNWAVNPAVELGRILATLVDGEGRVLVPGYGEGRIPLSPGEREALAALPEVDGVLRREFGLPRTYGGGRRLHELITHPSLNVRGIRAMYVGPGARTVIPDRATAALDLRPVPGQDGDRLLEKVRNHLERLGYRVLDREPTAEERHRHGKLVALRRRPGGYPAFRTPIDDPAVREVRRIVEGVVGRPPLVLPTIGGSGPLVLFREILGIPPFGVALYNHDSNQHSPNENLRLREYFRAVRIVAALLANYGRGDAGGGGRP